MDLFKKIKITIFNFILIISLAVYFANAENYKPTNSKNIKSSKINNRAKKNKKQNDKKYDNKITEKKNDKHIKKNDYKIDININGLNDIQYFYTKQSNEYERDVLPNGLHRNFSEMKNSHIMQDGHNALNLFGKIDINPEFNYYTVDNEERKKIFSVGFKISQPFFNASKNVDPRFASQEYVYVKTKYLQFQIGSVNSAGSKMRVDSQKIASGAGGIYGTWWKYVSFPMFNTSGLNTESIGALNAFSPVYILYPTLPNEAGFTSNHSVNINTISGNNFVNGNNQINGSLAQGFPTQGAYSNKISLYSKRINGFSFGLSYSPTTANTGFITRAINRDVQKNSNLSSGFVKNYTSIGLDYRKQFDRYGLGIALSATYEYGESSPLKYTNTGGSQQQTSVLSNVSYYDRYNLNAYAIGAQIFYKNYSIAYSYGDWGNSLLNKYMIVQDGKYTSVNKTKKSYYHTIGIGADYGIVRFGATYMCSSFSGYKLDVWSIGTDFKTLNLGYLRIQPYAEYVGYIFHTQNVQILSNNNTVYKAPVNRGYVIMFGLRVVF